MAQGESDRTSQNGVHQDGVRQGCGSPGRRNEDGGHDARAGAVVGGGIPAGPSLDDPWRGAKRDGGRGHCDCRAQLLPDGFRLPSVRAEMAAPPARHELELWSAGVAIVVVILGWIGQWKEEWLRWRHQAESCRLLRYRFLIHPAVCGSAPGGRGSGLKPSCMRSNALRSRAQFGKLRHTLHLKALSRGCRGEFYAPGGTRSVEPSRWNKVGGTKSRTPTVW
jgi:hypothetical protein